MTEAPNTPEPADDEPGKDPSNTPVGELTAPLDPDDDVHARIALVNSSRPEDRRGADQ